MYVRNMYEEIKRTITQKNYTFMLVSTTAKHSKRFLRLPDRKINNQVSLNILISDPKEAEKLFKIADGKIPNMLIDVEQKQSINLFQIAKATITRSNLLPYKPNDITLEAADQLFLKHFSGDLAQKAILVYGSGNISFKLALRLAERQAKVYLMGRNSEKVSKLIDTLNLILPSYFGSPIRHFTFEEDLDGIVSFISAEKIIGSDFASRVKASGLALDGGIGNFTGDFIKEAIQKGIHTLRLDVRLGLPFIEAGINAGNQMFFNEIMGEKIYKNTKIVAGGIIGNEGSVIVDRINHPTQIIGIANGIGGVKSGAEHTIIDKESIETLKKYLI